MEISIPTAAIATLLATSISVFFSLKINKSNKKDKLDSELNEILNISIQYPYLESEVFIKTWREERTSSDDIYVRYDLYATRVFNYIHRIYLHFNKNREKIDNYLAVKDWVRLHKDYWEYPSKEFENKDNYGDEFTKYIREYY